MGLLTAIELSLCCAHTCINVNIVATIDAYASYDHDEAYAVYYDATVYIVK